MPIYFPSSSVNSNPAQNFTTLSNVYNYAPQYLKNWRAAVGKVKAGTANATIMCLGDSTTYGGYSNGSASGIWKPLAYPKHLSNILANIGIPTTAESFMGSGSTAIDLNGPHDGRLTVGSGWSAPSAYTIGGSFYKATAATSNLAFAPSVNVDTFVIYYAKGSGFGTFSYNINGGTNTSVNTSNATNAFGSVTVTATLGANTLNLNWVSGATGALITGIIAYNSAAKTVNVINGGWSGATSASWLQNAQPFGPMQGTAAIAPNLTIVNLGINDWNAPTPLSTYQSNMQTIITNALSTGDCILVAPNPSDPGSYASIATQQTYVNVLYTLAQTNNIPLVDLWGRFVSYSAANATGIIYDGLHPNGAGYYDIATAIGKLLTAP